ncbi:TPA: DUF2971 domain-containing protein, partial [Klebsiella pneumoniae]
SPFILPMWAHYADDHQGCVIEFKFEETEGFIEEFINLKPEEDTTTLIPLDVIYSNNRPSLFDNDGLRLENGKYPTLSLFLKQHSRQFRAKSGC